MSKKPVTAEERQHLEKIKSLPCTLCGVEGMSEAHHVGTSMGVPKNHWATIPLCGPGSGWKKGCHEFLHEHGRRFRAWEDRTVGETVIEIYGDLDIDKLAKKRE